MKQGRASVSGRMDTKVEPRSTASNPGGVDALGQQFSNHVTDKGAIHPKITPMDAGRGYKAPMIGSAIHPSGSQGKHK